MPGQNKRNLFSLLWNWKWLIREGRLLYSYALGHCATVQVWFTPPVSFVYSLSTGDDDQSYVNQRLIESESCDTWKRLYIRKTFHLQPLQFDWLGK